MLHCLPSLYVGGAGRALVASLRELVGGPDRHLVCTLVDRRDLAAELGSIGIEVVSLGHRRPWHAPRTLWRLTRLLRSSGASVVHAHLFLARAYGGLAARIAGVGSVATVHATTVDVDPSATGIRATALRAVQRTVDRHLTDRIVFVSGAVADFALAADPTIRTHSTIVHNGIDVARFDRPAEATRAELTASLGIPPDATVLLNVGRMVPEKDQRVLPPIVAALRRRGVVAHAVIVGDGDQAPAVARAAEEAAVAEQVHLLGVREDVPTLLHLADVVLVTSVREGFSVAVLEAMASSCPIVATDIPAVREALDDGVEALVVPVGDVEAFAAAIVRLRNEPELGERLGAAARQRVEESFTIRVMADRLTALYWEVASEAGAVAKTVSRA